MDLRQTVSGTIHKVFPEGKYPSFVLKFMDGQYEKFLHVTLSSKMAEQITQFEAGGSAEVVIQAGSKEGNNDRWNTTLWCSKINSVNPF
jgi:hypothetical protein